MQKNRYSYTGSILRVCSLFCFLIVVFENTLLAQQTTTITYKGNVFEFTVPSKPDSVESGCVTGERKFVIITRSPILISMNGESIYDSTVSEYIEVTNIAKEKIKRSINIVLADISEKAALLPGRYQYTIHNIVIDKEGNIVYLEPETDALRPFIVYDANGNEVMLESLPDEVNKQITDVIVKAIEAISVGKLIINSEVKIYTFDLSGDVIVL